MTILYLIFLVYKHDKSLILPESLLPILIVILFMGLCASVLVDLAIILMITQ